ncbi:MAG: hypothetical protein ACE5FT_06205 [Candidatus Nanoarchaeia archaeon]
MNATAIIYDLKSIKGKNKTYLIRELFGYTDQSNHGKYTYHRPGTITPYIKEKWGQSVIITKRKDKQAATNILKKKNIPYKTKNIKIS